MKANGSEGYIQHRLADDRIPDRPDGRMSEYDLAASSSSRRENLESPHDLIMGTDDHPGLWEVNLQRRNDPSGRERHQKMASRSGDFGAEGRLTDEPLEEGRLQNSIDVYGLSQRIAGS
jgi:hypothetical protein